MTPGHGFKFKNRSVQYAHSSQYHPSHPLAHGTPDASLILLFLNGHAGPFLVFPSFSWARFALRFCPSRLLTAPPWLNKMWASLTPRDGAALGVPQKCYEQCGEYHFFYPPVVTSKPLTLTVTDDAFLESKSLLSTRDLCAADGPLIREFNSCNSCIETETENNSNYAVAYQNYIEPSFGDIIQRCISFGAGVTLSLGTSEPVTATIPMIGELPTGTEAVTATGGVTATVIASYILTQSAPFHQTTIAKTSTRSATGSSPSIDSSWLTTAQVTQTNIYTLLTGQIITVTELVNATVTRADWPGWPSSNRPGSNRPGRSTGVGDTITSIPTGETSPTENNGAAALTSGYGTLTTTPSSAGGRPKSTAGWVWALTAIAIAVILGGLVVAFVLFRRKRSKKSKHQRASSGSTPELRGTSGAGSRTELASEISSAELHTDSKMLAPELDSKVAPVEMDTEIRFELPTEFNMEKDIVEEAMTPISTCTDATRIPVSPLEEESLEEQKVLFTPGLNLRNKEEPQSHTKPL